MTLIGLMGVSKAGKTTSANYLVSNHGFVESSFASSLKRACKELFMLTDDQVNGSQESKETPDPRWFGCTPRVMLQFVGTDLLRNQLDAIMPGLGKDIFVHSFKLWYQEQVRLNPNILVVMSDLRFPNEIEVVQSLGGFIVKIERSSANAGVAVASHESEALVRRIQTCDHLILNDYSLAELYRELDVCVRAAQAMSATSPTDTTEH